MSGVAGAVGEIDQLRTENATLRDENERLANENARLEAVRAENEQLTALVQLQGGLEHETVATRVISRETLETRRVVSSTRGPRTASRRATSSSSRAARWPAG